MGVEVLHYLRARTRGPPSRVEYVRSRISQWLVTHPGSTTVEVQEGLQLGVSLARVQQILRGHPRVTSTFERRGRKGNRKRWWPMHPSPAADASNAP